MTANRITKNTMRNMSNPDRPSSSSSSFAAGARARARARAPSRGASGRGVQARLHVDGRVRDDAALAVRVDDALELAGLERDAHPLLQDLVALRRRQCRGSCRRRVAVVLVGLGVARRVAVEISDVRRVRLVEEDAHENSKQINVREAVDGRLNRSTSKPVRTMWLENSVSCARAPVTAAAICLVVNRRIAP